LSLFIDELQVWGKFVCRSVLPLLTFDFSFVFFLASVSAFNQTAALQFWTREGASVVLKLNVAYF
jgi:hypothetical protein